MGFSESELNKVQEFLDCYNKQLIKRIPVALPETMLNIARQQMVRMNNMSFEQVCLEIIYV